MESYRMLLGGEIQCGKMSVLSELTSKINVIPMKIPHRMF